MDAFVAHNRAPRPIGADQTPPPLQQLPGRFWFPSSSPPPPPPPPHNLQHLPHQYHQPYHHWPPPDGLQRDNLQNHHRLPPSHLTPPPPPPPPPHIPPISFHGNPHLPPYPAPSMHPPHVYPTPPRVPYPNFSPSHHPPFPVHHSASYPTFYNQAWGNSSLPQQQGWESTGRDSPYGNEEDWAARARAWAAAKSPTDGNFPQLPYMPAKKSEDNRFLYHDQYQQSVLHNAGDEGTATNPSHEPLVPQSSIPTPLSYEQEVSSSYSLAQGPRETLEQSASFSKQLSLPIPGCSYSTPPIRRFSAELNYNGGRELTEHFTEDSEKPHVESVFVSELDTQHQNSFVSGNIASRGMDYHQVAVPEHSWVPNGPGARAPISSISSVPQFNPSFVSQPSLPGQPSFVFEGLEGPSIHPSIPSAGLPVDFTSGSSINNAAFLAGETGGAFSNERLKKTAVPNWLREEIIKNKSVISNPGPSSSTGNFFRSTVSEDSDKLFSKSDQGTMSADSARSTEDDEHEDVMEAERSAAIKQEIKHVLTEVLLKVTNRLFDEIATEVLNENDMETESEGHHHSVSDDLQASIKSMGPNAKATAKAQLTVKAEESKALSSSKNSNSSSHGGNILGLADYSSDDEDDDNKNQIINYNSEGANKEADNGTITEEVHTGASSEVLVENVATMDRSLQGHSSAGESNPSGKNVLPAENSEASVKSQMTTDATYDECNYENVVHPFDTVNNASPEDELGGNDEIRPKTANENHNVRLSHEDASTSNSSCPKHLDGRSSTASVKELHNVATKTCPILIDNVILKDLKNERTENRGPRKEGDVEKSIKHGACIKDHNSRERPDNRKDGGKEINKDKRDLKREDDWKKMERPRGEGDDHSIPFTKDSGRSKSRRSVSPSRRFRSHGDNYFKSRDGIAVDDSSKNAKSRNRQSHKRSRSPSALRSKARQVSRSPPSRPSHNRHSPYSLDRRSNKKSRSRSVSPDYRLPSRRHKI